MSTERRLEFETQCTCGKGTYRVDYCEVDHAWPTATPQWYESHIACKECAEKFSLEQRGRNFVLIENSALKEQKNRRDIAHIKSKEIIADYEVQAAFKQFEGFLNTQKSVAAIYRVFNQLGLAHESEGTFRRHWTSAADWIKSYGGPHTLIPIFKLMKLPTESIEKLLAELAKLDKAAAEEPKQYGKAIYRVP